MLKICERRFLRLGSSEKLTKQICHELSQSFEYEVSLSLSLSLSLFLISHFIIAQDDVLWVKFSSITDLPECTSGVCTHSDPDFQIVLDSIGAERISLAMPAISEFPQASLYGLDLVYEIEIQSNGDVGVAENLLSAFSFIDYVDRVSESVPLHTPNDYTLLDTEVGSNWQLNLINAQNAWELSKNAHQIKIGIIESGRIDENHEDLEDVLYSSISGNVNYHKTMVAGCASVSTNNGIGISSIGYNAKLMSYPSGINGMLMAVADGANVVNISARWSCFPWINAQLCINMLADMGIIIVAAAGNGNIGTSCNVNQYAYPASYENVISVSSVGEDNRHLDMYTQGSHTHNDKVSLCAPGYSVLSTAPNSQYARSTGTSLASPIVAGTVALLLNINPCLDHDDILQILEDSADPIDDVSDFPPNSLGAGRLNAFEACSLAMQTTDLLDGEVTGTETWDGDLIIGQDIHIEPGASLTLTGTLKMGPGKKIIVKQGAEFIVDGGKITNSECGDHFWQGIEVWGTTTESQFPMLSGHQGSLKLYDAVIENAAQGVVNWGGWDYRGGIIQAYNSTFLNCRKAVSFMKYQNFDPGSGDYLWDLSFFQGCTFINDDNHLIPAFKIPPLPLVTLWDVHGVSFTGCSFINEMTTSNYEQRQHGVFSIDADYNITHQCNLDELLPPCPDFTRSSFVGFNEAVVASNSSNNAAPRISATDFESNMIGIHFSGAHFGTAVGNIFKLGGLDFDGSQPGEAQNHLGIRAWESSSWILEENEFEKDPMSPSGRMVHGVLIENSGDNNLQLYNNKFSNLEAATVITGKNASESNAFDGLRLICNENENNNGDFEIRLNQDNEFGTISSYQVGNPSPSFPPAGNTFSIGDGFNTNFVNFDFQSEAHYYYWYHGLASHQTPNPDEVNVSPGTWTAQNMKGSNSCPLNYDGSVYKQDINDLKDEFYDVKSDYFNLLYTYDQLLDNGSTEGLLVTCSAVLQFLFPSI